MDGPPKDKDVEIEILNNNYENLITDTSTLYRLQKTRSSF